MMKKSYKILLSAFLAMLIGLALYSSCSAQALLDGKEDAQYSPNCKSSGNCEVRDFAVLGVRIVQFILGISGSVALLFFVYGGIRFIISAGSSDKVNSAKQIIVNSVVGLIVIFMTWSILTFVFKTLGVTADWTTTGWFKGT